MGFYIETPADHDKAKQLIKEQSAVMLDMAPKSLAEVPEDKMLVCVVVNGFFDAAAVAFDERELRNLADPEDKRRKTWLLMDREIVYNLCPSVKMQVEHGRMPTSRR